MKKLLLPFLSALLLAACSGGSAVAGSWILDGGATTTAMEAAIAAQMKGAEGPQAAVMEAVLKGIKESMKKMRSEIDIAADGTFTVHSDAPDGSHTHVHGKWTQQGNAISFTGKAEDQDKEETYSGTLAGDELRLEQSQGGQKMTMVFRRKK